MKLPLRTTLGCVLVGIKETPYEYNGQKGVRHELSLECDEAVGTVVCDKPTYERALAIGKYKAVELYGDFDTAYKTFKVFSIEAVNDKKQ